MPQRIQLCRTKGWRLPEGAISVARPSKLGNMFKVGAIAEVSIAGTDGLFYDMMELDVTPGIAVALYRSEWKGRLNAPLDKDVHPDAADELWGQVALMASADGRDVGCYCALDAACHGDVVIELAPIAARLLANR